MAGRVVETDWKVVFPLKIRIFGPKSVFAQFEGWSRVGPDPPSPGEPTAHFGRKNPLSSP